jgi:hypothetical protein
MHIPIKKPNFMVYDNQIRKAVYKYIRDVFFPEFKKSIGVEHDFHHHTEIWAYTMDGVTAWFSYASGEDGEMTIPDTVFIPWEILDITFNE